MEKRSRALVFHGGEVRDSNPTLGILFQRKEEEFNSQKITFSPANRGTSIERRQNDRMDERQCINEIRL